MSKPKRLIAVWVTAVLAMSLVGVGATVRPAAAAPTTFTTPGGWSYVVPVGVTALTVEVYGASGADPSVDTYGGVGGLGGKTIGTLPVVAGTTYYAFVGGAGSGKTGGLGGAGDGGANGCQCPPRDGGGGGGASTFYLEGVDLILAGGGGGGAPGNNGGAGAGGNNSGGGGGVPVGTTNGTAATGGTATEGGTGGTQADTGTGGSPGVNGGFKTGGAAGTDYNSAGGGGGGGFYGGGGGSGGFLGGGGGGGSGFVHLDVTILTQEDGANAGNGKIVITPVTPVTSNPTVEVKSPNGGEFWLKGSPHTIRWVYANAPGASVKIALLRNGTHVLTIVEKRPVGKNGQGSFNWTPPHSLSSGDGYKVRITIKNTTPAKFDSSNTTFGLYAPF